MTARISKLPMLVREHGSCFCDLDSGLDAPQLTRELESIWLTEMSDQLPPAAQLDAFDISSAQCPPRQWLPENMSLQTHDAFLPLPEDAIRS